MHPSELVSTLAILDLNLDLCLGSCDTAFYIAIWMTLVYHDQYLNPWSPEAKANTLPLSLQGALVLIALFCKIDTFSCTFPEEEDCASLRSVAGSVGTEAQQGSEDGDIEEVKKGMNYFIGNIT